MGHFIHCTPLQPGFVAEVTGVEWCKPVADEVCNEIRAALHKYGVLVFRATGLDDASHVEFARKFGPLDSMSIPKAAGIKLRIQTPELTDVSNIEPDGSLTDPDSLKGNFGKGNLVFHVDNSYNAQRASYSILRAAEVPVPPVGGNTEFVDVRRAWRELPEGWKQEILARDYQVAHSIWHSRKLGSPRFFERLDPTRYPMALRKLVESPDDGGDGSLEERSASDMRLHIPSHCHHIEGLAPDESREKLDFLYRHATQDAFIVSISWQGPGDMIMWDNRIVLHRGTPMHEIRRRDLRRATVLDVGPNGQSLNDIDPTASWKALFDVAKLYESPDLPDATQEVKTC